MLSKAFVEHLLEGHTKEVNKAVAKLRYYLDLFVEFPVSCLCFGTGLKLMIEGSSSKLIHGMAGIGGLAVLLNALCLSNSYGRCQAALREDWELQKV